MRKAFLAVAWMLVAGFWLAQAPVVHADTNIVTIAFTTANPMPLNQGFGGFSTDFLDNGLEYGNTNFQQLAGTLSPGWLHYPSGIGDDAFSWSNGLTDTNMINKFYDFTHSSSDTNLLWDSYQPLIGKGGALFSDFAAMCRNIGGPKIIVCVNAFTDDPTSAGNFAAFALSNHIPVAAWELCNEPYNFTGSNNFFTNATDYANKMLPYRDAIKAADPNAVVAVFFDDPAINGTNSSWNKKLSQYRPQYWDAAVYHHYPRAGSLTNFSELMAIDNNVLANQTAAYMTNYLVGLNTNANLPYLVTEFAPVLGNGGNGPNLPTTSLYGGIYAAEYLMRMSVVPQMAFVGTWQLADEAGIYMTNKNRVATTTAYSGHYTTNTENLDFGFYLSAQVCGEAITDWVLSRSTATYPTIVGTNGPVVSDDTNGVTTIPALYAQAYQGANGKRYVLVTNKGTNPVTVEITQDDTNFTGEFLETFVTGSNPALTNDSPPPNNVGIQSQMTNNPVIIPQYSVVRLEWTNVVVRPPCLNIGVTNSLPNLSWTGLADVVYNVQSTTNLAGTTWETLGKISSANTNFIFTDECPSPMRFYRLVVP